jgi:hypothetical protein
MVFLVFKVTHISIVKPQGSKRKLFYHKTGGYNIMAQVVDCSKTFIDIFVGLLDKVNDSKVLCKTCTLKLNTMGCLSLAKIFKMGFSFTIWVIRDIH